MDSGKFMFEGMKALSIFIIVSFCGVITFLTTWAASGDNLLIGILASSSVMILIFFILNILISQSRRNTNG